MEPPPPTEPRKNLDVECLRCGAMNLPENRICGRCGASLPLVYDGEGNVSGSGRNLRMEAFLNQTAHRRARASPTSIGWILRLGVILFAIFIAFRILHRK